MTVQFTVASGRYVIGLVLRTSNCRLFQSNDYGTRRQSRPMNQPHDMAAAPKPPMFIEGLPRDNTQLSPMAIPRLAADSEDWPLERKLSIMRTHSRNSRIIRAMNMEQDLNKVESMYDTVAKEYADAFTGEHEKKPKDREILRRFAMEIGTRKPVWDFGCGPGQTTKYLKNLGVEISGLDLSEKLLQQARALHPEIHFRKGNILELDFENDSLAGVVAFYAMVHFTEGQVGAALREVFRILAPGGLFLFTFHIGDETIRIQEFLGRRIDIDFMLFTTAFISGCLKQTGFENLETIEREPYPGVEYQSRRGYVFAVKPV